MPPPLRLTAWPTSRFLWSPKGLQLDYWHLSRERERKFATSGSGQQNSGAKFANERPAGATFSLHLAGPQGRWRWAPLSLPAEFGGCANGAQKQEQSGKDTFSQPQPSHSSGQRTFGHLGPPLRQRAHIVADVTPSWVSPKPSGEPLGACRWGDKTIPAQRWPFGSSARRPDCVSGVWGHRWPSLSAARC